MSCVRLTLVDRTNEYANIYLDVFVAPDGSFDNKVVTHGRWGDLKGEPWPFALQPRKASEDAVVDFGTGVEDAGYDRFGRINLFAKKLTRGEMTTLTSGDDVVCFFIRDAKIMPSGEDYFLSVSPLPPVDPPATS